MSDIPKDGTVIVKQEPTESRTGSETDSCEFLDCAEDLKNVELVQKDQESYIQGKDQRSEVNFKPRKLIHYQGLQDFKALLYAH